MLLRLLYHSFQFPITYGQNILNKRIEYLCSIFFLHFVSQKRMQQFHAKKNYKA